MFSFFKVHHFVFWQHQAPDHYCGENTLNHVTLCILSDLHWVFVVICKPNTPARTASVKHYALLPKKGKSHDRVQEGKGGRRGVFIYCLNLGTELWPRRYLGGLMWRLKISGNAEWIWSIRGNNYGCGGERWSDWLHDRCCLTSIRYVPFLKGKATYFMTFKCLCASFCRFY